jgi:hypothetical protein
MHLSAHGKTPFCRFPQIKGKIRQGSSAASSSRLQGLRAKQLVMK